MQVSLFCPPDAQMQGVACRQRDRDRDRDRGTETETQRDRCRHTDLALFHFLEQLPPDLHTLFISVVPALHACLRVASI
jgi:hypothetical protein